VTDTPFYLSHGKEGPVHRYFWQDRPREPFLQVDGPQHLVFRSGDRYLSFLWKAGRLAGESAPLHASLFRTRACRNPLEVECLNLVTGETRSLLPHTPVRIGMDGEGLVLDNLPLTGEVLALRWPADSAPTH
jgi:hypothetical protein